MANSDSPMGLKAVKYLSGAPYNGAGNVYAVAAADANVIAPGDPVIVTGTSTPRGVPYVTRATAGATNRITGVMQGKVSYGQTVIKQDDPVSTRASTLQYVLISDSNDIVYNVQASGTIAVTDISNTFNLLIPASTIDGTSSCELGAATGLATAQVRVLRLHDVENNDIGLNANMEVTINLPTITNDTVGV